jgi:hypothetical protein
MLTLYWFCFVTGGVFVLLAVFGGHTDDGGHLGWGGGWDGAWDGGWDGGLDNALAEQADDFHGDLGLTSDADSQGADLLGGDIELVDRDTAQKARRGARSRRRTGLHPMSKTMPSGMPNGVSSQIPGTTPINIPRLMLNGILRRVPSVVLSFKFWTFATCFFGLTGLVLSHLSVALPSPWIVALALGMGTLLGTLVSGSLQFLRRRRVDSLVRSQDLVGLCGRVEVPFDADSRGKVRLQVKGNLVDFMAYTDEPRPLHVGDTILVVGSENNRLWVVSTEHTDSLIR